MALQERNSQSFRQPQVPAAVLSHRRVAVLAYYLSEFDDEPHGLHRPEGGRADHHVWQGGKTDECRFRITNDGHGDLVGSDTPKEALVRVSGLNRWRDYLLIRYGTQHAVMSPHSARKAKEKSKLYQLLRDQGHV